MVKTTHSDTETENFAIKIAQKIKGGDTVALFGDLGGGKTTFTKGLAKALKVKEEITSPTFVVMKKYPAKLKDKDIEFVHIDAYRCDSVEDVESIGIEDYLNRPDAVVIVEWADKIRKILPSKIIRLKFKFINENTREIDYDFSD